MFCNLIQKITGKQILILVSTTRFKTPFQPSSRFALGGGGGRGGGTRQG
jgi:hypothetical protein